jgi:hypothetical protein
VLEGEAWDGTNFNWWDMEIKAYALNLTFEPSHIVELVEESPPTIGQPTIFHRFAKPELFGGLMVEVAVFMGVESERAEREIKEVFGFMKHLAKIKEKTYSSINQAKLSEIYPGVSWRKLWQIFTNTWATQPTLLADEFFIKGLQEVIKHTSPRVIANYLGWIYVFDRRDTFGPRNAAMKSQR